MGRRTVRHDKVLLSIIAALVISGFFIFLSASLGHLARSGNSIVGTLVSQIGFGLIGGVAALFVTSNINYRLWKRFAPHIYAAALVVTALVFVPLLGFSHGGATRWIAVGPITFQPAEALKIAVVLMSAAYFAQYRTKLDQPIYALGIFFGVLFVPALLLMFQPDHGTLGVLIASVGAMLFVAGVKWRDIGIVVAVGVVAVVLIGTFRPYVLDRITTFLRPFDDPQGSSYQIKQSLIAIGSGGVFGRGYGQSVQKFSYLPEPMSDSLFAVAGEEFGFAGSLFLIGLFLALAARGFFIATRTADYFGGLLAVGITVYLAGQAFVNIGAMVGLLPLTGIPLVFMSQGGTAMFVALGSAGILLNISRSMKRT